MCTWCWKSHVFGKLFPRATTTAAASALFPLFALLLRGMWNYKRPRRTADQAKIINFFPIDLVNGTSAFNHMTFSSCAVRSYFIYIFTQICQCCPKTPDTRNANSEAVLVYVLHCGDCGHWLSLWSEGPSCVWNGSFLVQLCSYCFIKTFISLILLNSSAKLFCTLCFLKQLCVLFWLNIFCCQTPHRRCCMCRDSDGIRGIY